ncbi:unnamed protein product [Ixodes persulcatus]
MHLSLFKPWHQQSCISTHLIHTLLSSKEQCDRKNEELTGAASTSLGVPTRSPRRNNALVGTVRNVVLSKRNSPKEPPENKVSTTIRYITTTVHHQSLVCTGLEWGCCSGVVATSYDLN